MDTKYFSYFLEIAKEKNISKAADKLFVSQSTLSQFLAREEKELGIKLFIRRKNSLSLTYAGQLYNDACEDILNRKLALYKELSNIAQSKTGYISIGITPQWGGEMFAEIYPVFKANFPNCIINLVEDTAKPLLELLQKGSLDMAVLALNDTASLSLSYNIICKEEFLLAVPHIFFEKQENICETGKNPSRMDITKFKYGNFIISRNGTTIRDIQNEIFHANDMNPNIVCEINNFSATLKLVANGIGLSIIPKSYINDDPRISFYKLTPPWYWKIATVFRKGFSPSISDLYLLDSIKSYFQQPAKVE